MKKITEHLYVCNQFDYYTCSGSKDFSVCFCAKHPFHQKVVGYTGNLNKFHPEYLIARRPEEHLISLNLIDANDYAYIPKEIIEAALQFIDEEINAGHDVLLVCNQGKSRSATIAMLYMIKSGYFSLDIAFEDIESRFREIYPEYEPGKGMREFAFRYFNELIQED